MGLDGQSFGQCHLASQRWVRPFMVFALSGRAGGFMGRPVLCSGLCSVQRLGCARPTHRVHVGSGQPAAVASLPMARVGALALGSSSRLSVGSVGVAAARVLVEFCGGGDVVLDAASGNCFWRCGHTSCFMEAQAGQAVATTVARTMVADAGIDTADLVVVSTGQLGGFRRQSVSHTLGHAGGDSIDICRGGVVATVAGCWLDIASADDSAGTFVAAALGCLAHCRTPCVVRCVGFGGKRTLDTQSPEVGAVCLGSELACNGVLAVAPACARHGANVVCRHWARQRRVGANRAAQFGV